MGARARATRRSLRAKNYRGDNPYQREHDDLIASIRGAGPYRFEGDYGAIAAMTAVHGPHGDVLRRS